VPKTSPITDTANTAQSEEVFEKNLEFEAWYHTDQLVLSGMMASLTEGVFSQVLSLTSISSAATLWSAINQSFGAQSKARINTLRGELFSSRKGNLSVTEYCDMVRGIVD
jgi:hypothetical protein